MINKLILIFSLSLIVLLQAGCDSSLSADEQFLTGKTYQKGDGVKKDYAKAAEWYKKAADRGHMEAQYTLGYMYHKGYGVKINESESLRYFKMAADQGDEDSQKLLASLAAEEKSRVARSQMSYAERYAAEIKSKMMSGGACGSLKQQIDTFVNTSYPDNIKVKQIDKIIDAADRAGCIMY